MTPKTFAGYCRTSISNQKESIQAQKEAITRYCKAHGYKVKFFIDDGISAYKLRPKYEKMMESIDNFDGIIVTDITRFGRNTEDLLVKINLVKEKKRDFIMINQNINTATKEGRLLLTILAAIADFERSMIRERLESGKEFAKVHGTKSGLPMHRPRKEVNWKQFDYFKNLGLSVPKIAVQLGMSKSTLYDRIDEREASEPVPP